MPAMANCPYCGKLTDPNLGNCVHCGGYLQRNAPGQQAPRRGPSATSQTCPACGALVQAGDIICVACGTSILTGQKIIEGKKVGETKRSIPLVQIVGIAGGIAAVILIGLLLYWLTRDPLKQATELATQGKLSEAAQILQNVVARNPNNARAQFELGKIKWRQTLLTDAADAFELAAQNDPANIDAHLYAALTLAQQKNPATRAREIGLLENLLREDPANVEATYLLALAKGASGDFQGQLDAIDKAAAPDNDPVVAQLRAAAHALLGEYSEAQSQLTSAIQQSPDAAAAGDLHATAGFIASLQGQIDQAGDELAKAAGSSTNIEGITQSQLGLTYVSQGRLAEAEEAFRKALARDPGSEVAKFFGAVCQVAQGEEAEALTLFESIYRGNGPYAAAASIQVAQVYLRRGDVDRASDTSDRALQLGDKSAALFTLKGRIQIKQNQEAPAQESFKQAIQADPDYAPAHLENGLLYVKRGVMGEGVRELEQYITLVDPNAPDARIAEVRAMIEQLKQAGNLEGGTSASVQISESEKRS